jgi:hypothetical protein
MLTRTIAARSALWIAASLLALAGPALAGGSNLRHVPNGFVRAVAVDLAEDRAYLAGSFDRIGPPTGGAIPLDLATAVPSPASFAKIAGHVNAIVADGAGGHFIGGDFVAAGGASRNLAHIWGDYTVDDTWPMVVDGPVQGLALANGTLFVAGSFTEIAGANRQGLAAVDVATGVPLPWNAQLNGVGNCVTVADGRVYVGGSFTQAGGAAHFNLAALDATTAMATPFLCDANFPVLSFSKSSTQLYVGGRFTTLRGQARARMGEVDLVTGVPTARIFDVNNEVRSLSVQGSRLFAAGAFTMVGAQSRNRLASFDLTTAALEPWNPNASSNVNAIAVQGTTLYAGGQFATIGGQPRRRLAAVHTTTGAIGAWDQPDLGDVLSLGVNGSLLYVGATMSCIGGVSRNNLASIELSSGEVTDWNPNVSVPLNDVLVHGDHVYIAGGPMTVGGEVRQGLAAVHKSTGAVSSWAPTVPGSVTSLAKDATHLYLGGSFTQVNGATRVNLAAVDFAAGALHPTFSASTNFPPQKLHRLDNRLLAGGFFFLANGEPRANVAGFDATTGDLLPWEPNPDGPVFWFWSRDTDVLMAGFFSNLAASARRGWAFVGPLGSVLSLDVGCEPAQVLTAIGRGSAPRKAPGTPGVTTTSETVYAGGLFTQAGGQNRRFVAAFDVATGLATDWAPELNGPVNALADGGPLLFVTGAFTRVGDQPYANLAAIPFDDATTDVAWIPSAGTLSLAPGVPNPARAQTTLTFALPRASRAILEVYDLRGARLAVPMDGDLPAGTHRVTVDTRRWPAGVYAARLSAGGERASRRIVVVR